MNTTTNNSGWVRWLAAVLPLLLIAPNVGLVFSDQMGFIESVLNIMVPLSAYMLLMSLWKRTGIMTLIMIPMMCFAGFQIVLLYLYGGSIIGVDMFLNVVTTNMTEVNELLGNLLIAIGIILLLYLPAIILAIISICKKLYLPGKFQKKYFKGSLISFGVSLILLFIATLSTSYSAGVSLFPLNIFENLVSAFQRTARLNNYPYTSSGFTYSPKREASSGKEVYVMVVGETGRAADWELAGYGRSTTPRLKSLNNLIFYPHALTESNTTHKSVPMLISPLTAQTFNSIDSIKSAITLFKEAGFKTAFFSNQQRNRSYTEYFGSEADTTIYLSDLDVLPLDGNLVELLKEFVADPTADKKFAVIHTYGSHFKYNDRYPIGFGDFKPDAIADANRNTRDRLINAFDNSILYADSCLNAMAEVLNVPGLRSAMVYATDHGEDIFDDSRSRFLHASPIPTYYQLHVPMFVWLSDAYAESYPESLATLKENSIRQVSSTASFFHTIVDLSGIDTPCFNPGSSLASEMYKEPVRYFLTDRNEAIKAADSGLLESDYQQFEKAGIRF